MVTVPGEGGSSDGANPGHALVYFGSASFGDETGRESLRVDGDADKLPFGFAAAPAGDVDADGQKDFVIGYPTPRLYRGSSRSVIATDIPLLETGETVERLSAGDVTGDGYSDLLAVLWAPAVEHERYDFLPGGSNGFGDARTLLETETYTVAPLLVGAAWHYSPLVQVSLYLGGGGSRSTPDAVYTVRRELLFVSTGVPRAVGDVNGDGFDDVFLIEDFDITGTLFFGGLELDPTADDEIAVSLE